MQPLTARHYLESLLRESRDDYGLVRLSLGVIAGGERSFAYVDQGALTTGTSTDTVLIRCCNLIDLFTGALVRQAVCAEQFGWNDTVASIGVLGQLFDWSRFQDITVRHLVDHSHGLDDSLIPCLPLHENGRIDIEALGEKMTRHPPIAQPGKIYNYSRAGIWLAAGLLERTGNAKYGELLWQKLFRRLGMGSVGGDYQRMYLGADFEAHVSINDVLSFLAAHLGETDTLRFDVADIAANKFRFPGLALAGLGMCLGWKDYGSDWYGEDIQWTGNSASIRFNPRLQLAAVLRRGTGLDRRLHFRALSHVMPELIDGNPPSILCPTGVDCENISAYQGTFSVASTSIIVWANALGRLFSSTVDHTAETGATGRVDNPLIRVGEHLFHLTDGNTSCPRFIQFIDKGSDGHFQFVWNGKNIWRRASSDCLVNAVGIIGEDSLFGNDGLFSSIDVSLEELLARC
jgi:CubicO group peptidase (beta-lactamase class C family)